LLEATAGGNAGTAITLLCNAGIQMSEAFLPQAVDRSDGRATDVMATEPWRERDVDDVFAYGSDTAQIQWQEKPWSVCIESDPALPHWIVFAPRGAGFICIEPISHFPNVVNVQPAPAEARGGLKKLGPSEVRSTCTTFRIVPSAAVT
jgi:aldose 1-epimerase